MRWLVLSLLLLVGAPAGATAQTVETDPLQCWWRTSTPAVRVGQPFAVVLTCAVVETTSVTVVPDQGPLDPAVAQMPPFEVLGGTHHGDLRTTDHRFFQYEYRLRLVTEDAFGKDIKLPDMAVSYHLQSRTGHGAALEGRELSYNLPPMSVRVLSLVPSDEADIRDATTATFGEVESRLFRANVLRTTAGVLFALAGLGLIVAVVRLFGGYRSKTATDTWMIPDVAILRALRRDLRAIERERRSSGWTAALVDRLTTALRVSAAYALSRRVTQLPADDVQGHEGHLLVATGWLRRRQVAVVGSVTSEMFRQSRRDESADGFDELARALDRVTITQYGREPRVDDDELDAAIDAATRAVRQMTARHTWLRRKLAEAGRLRAPVGQRAWSRWNG